MVPMIQKHRLITTSLLAVLTLSACGKKTDVITPAPAPAPATTQAETPTVTSTEQNIPAPRNVSDFNNTENTNRTTPVAEAPKPKSEVSEVITPLPPLPMMPSTPAQAAKLDIATTAPALELGVNELPSDYRSNDATSVYRNNLTKRMTGGVTADGLVYTSSSTDDLLTFLRLRNEKADPASKRANLKAAASVVSAKISIGTFANDVTVTLKINEGKEVKVYNVAGSLAEVESAPLKLVRSGNGEMTTGARSLEGTVKCLDLDGQCETTFVRLRIGEPGASAILNVVFRNSIADLFFTLPGEYTDNPEYLALREFAINTIQQNTGDNKIKSTKMSSWEVVNGRSGVELSMTGANNELLAFTAPLLAPEAGTGVNINLGRLPKTPENELDVITVNQPKLNYANTIGDARLIANNGLGQVRIALKMRRRASYAQDQFAVTFMRKIKPIIELSDDNLK